MWQYNTAMINTTGEITFISATDCEMPFEYVFLQSKKKVVFLFKPKNTNKPLMVEQNIHMLALSSL